MDDRVQSQRQTYVDMEGKGAHDSCIESIGLLFDDGPVEVGGAG